jgi:hypothetical protein
MLNSVQSVFLALLVAVVFAAPASAQGIIGVWHGQMNDGSYNQVVIQGNGLISQQQTYNVGGGSTQLFMRGQWRMIAENTVRVDVTDYQPRQWCGPLGCQPIRYPQVIHFQFVLTDANTMRLQDGWLTRVGSEGYGGQGTVGK